MVGKEEKWAERETKEKRKREKKFTPLKNFRKRSNPSPLLLFLPLLLLLENKMTFAPQLEFFPLAGPVSLEGKTLVVVRCLFVRTRKKQKKIIRSRPLASFPCSLVSSSLRSLSFSHSPSQLNKPRQPAVSIGNVGQLAADLLIATLGLEPCGTMLSPTALPVVGLGATGGSGSVGDGDDDEGGRERLSTELELFSPPSSSSGSSSEWVLLQQRSPDAPGSSRAAAKALGGWAKASGIEKILILASVDAADRRDAALNSSSDPSSGPKTLAFVASGGAALGEWTAKAESCGAASLPAEEEEGGNAALSSHETGLPPRGERRLPPWPLLAAAKDGAAPPALALLSYATEGDNAADAVSLAAAAAGVLGVEVPSTKDAAAAAAPAPSAPFSKGTIPVSGPWRAPAAWAAAYGGRAVPVEM